MKTITVRDLRNHYLSVMERVENGEALQIVRRGKAFARLTPENVIPRKVDWSKSAGFALDRKKIRPLSRKESIELLEASRGED